MAVQKQKFTAQCLFYQRVRFLSADLRPILEPSIWILYVETEDTDTHSTYCTHTVQEEAFLHILTSLEPACQQR